MMTRALKTRPAAAISSDSPINLARRWESGSLSWFTWENRGTSWKIIEHHGTSSGFYRKPGHYRDLPLIQ